MIGSMRRCTQIAGVLLLTYWVLLASSVASGQTHGLKFGPEPRLEVLPVLLVPSDNKSITPPVIQQTTKLLYSHLETAQQTYKRLLVTDTFKIADGNLVVHRSKIPHAYYLPPTYGEAMTAWQKAHPPG